MAQLKNTSISDTGFLQLPAGTTGQRPASPSAGMIRFNTDTRSTEWYDGTHGAWFPTGVVPPSATGGTVTNITQGGVGYRVHTFTTVGTSTFTVTRSGQVEYLIVAGGGAAAGDVAGAGGGGGSLQGSIHINSGTYNIVVGNGGQSSGSDGGNSSALNFVAFGGGGGGNWSTGVGRVGGSGGGGSGSGAGGPGIPGQGNSGGGLTGGFAGGSYGAGGGGGAGGPGQNPYLISGVLFGGNGGPGIKSAITGSLIGYGGGGGGGGGGDSAGVGGAGTATDGGGNGSNRWLAISGFPGTPNTGGGGGGTGRFNGIGTGGSGIVIIRYRTS
jgi:hypothetical protein